MNVESVPLERTILIIDDNPTNLSVLSDYLEEWGFDIIMALDGQDGLKIAQTVHPDLILLDVTMPGIDGFETCRQLKMNESTQDIAVIFMTALTGEDDKLKAFDAGAVDYITKPIQQREVLARVNTHLQLHRLAQNLQAANVTLSKRALQLEISSQVSRQITVILDQAQLLTTIVNLIRTEFGYSFVGVWLFDELQNSLVLRAGNKDPKSKMPEPGSVVSLDIPDKIIVLAYQTGQPCLENKFNSHPLRTTPKSGPSLSQARSEMALPLQVETRKVGVLDIRSEQVEAFDRDDQLVLQTVADQIAIAIHYARLHSLEKHLRQLETKKLNVYDWLENLLKWLRIQGSLMAHETGPIAISVVDVEIGRDKVTAELLIPPPPEELEKLLKLIHYGNLPAVKQEGLRLEQLNDQYKPFARQLQALAGQFDEDALLDLVKLYFPSEDV